MTAIEFNHVSKQYRLGLVSTGTLSHDLNRFWQTKVLRREDPYLKVGEVNDRSKKGGSDYVWALRDIDFKVEQGDVVGIIGRNGAGKSTLLKLLSRVTSPTTGLIRVRGRIASLLEVGTGFHQEMTGRENIYMNGSIMGMRKAEIDRKLDEIVEFSGCERYLDTPVKRYSSGMTVRLGFAIAAHLEPDILVVDEVLAVGDAEFQKKAVGKMQDVAKGEGRTVLFVSHNMAAVRGLCKRGIVLRNGQVQFSGTAAAAIDEYLHVGSGHGDDKIVDGISWIKPGLDIKSIRINGTDAAHSFIQSGQEALCVEIEGFSAHALTSEISMVFRNEDETPLASFPFCDKTGKLYTLNGVFSVQKTVKLPKTLYKGILKVDIFFHQPNVEFQLKAPGCCRLDCEGFLCEYGQPILQRRSGLMQFESMN